MTKFRPQGAYLFKKKSTANTKAKTIRKTGHRAIVQKASKTTQKRSPSLKWAVFKGQKRKS